MDHATLLTTMGCLAALYLLSFAIMLSLPGIRHLQAN